jgi:hypothetical protein
MDKNAQGQRLLPQSTNGFHFDTGSSLTESASSLDTAPSSSSIENAFGSRQFGTSASGSGLFGTSSSGRTSRGLFGSYSSSSYSSSLDKPRDYDFDYISTTRSTGPGYERTSVHRSGSVGNGMSYLMQERFKHMQDTVQSAHQRLTHTGDQLNHVQQRISLICADGNNLSERVAKSSANVATVQAQLVEMNKEMTRMQDRFSAEINSVQEQLEKKMADNSERIQRLEASLARFEDL